MGSHAKPRLAEKGVTPKPACHNEDLFQCKCMDDFGTIEKAGCYMKKDEKSRFASPRT